MTSRDVAVFFARVWPVWCPGSVKVELRPRVKSCAFRATVFQDAGSWWVLADQEEEARKLLWLCLHEAGHVALGHVTGPHTGWLAEARAAMAGGGSVAGAATLASVCKATPTRARIEREADAWADARLPWYWRILTEWRDPVKAAGCVWWTVNKYKEAGLKWQL